MVVAEIRNLYKRNEEPVKGLILAVYSGFVIALYSFPKYWIPLQTYVRICLVFKNIRFTEFFIMAASEFGYIWIMVG